MSVHQTKSGTWRVMWRDSQGRQRQRNFRLKKDAERVDRDLHRKRELNPFGLDVEAKPMTVAELYADWVANHAAPNLSPNTRASYASAWRAQLEPRIGSMDVREVTPEVCADLAGAMKTAKVGQAAQAKSLALLSSILRRAVVKGRLPYHPMRGAVRVPQPKRQRVVNPPTPEAIWQLAAALRESGDEAGRILVLLVGFAGLRPQEALALDWADVGAGVLNIERAAVLGEVTGTKTGTARTVTLVPALEAELVGYRMSQGLPATGLVLAGREGGPWSNASYRNWRRRKFKPAAEATDLARPYDLRHAYASLLLHEGRSVIEVAAELGHAPSVCLDTYGHVMRGLGKRRVKAATAITRAKHVGSELARSKAKGRKPRSRRGESNPRPLHYEGNQDE